ncbi:MAG: inositol-phosphate phosphatase / L-galactose 1-phosphate phosphatase, partial [Parcubacteria group bacterium Greene0416_79]
MNEASQKFLETARAAVKKAEPIFRRHFGKSTGIATKPGKVPSFVSDADKEIEALLIREISSQFPAHSIVGEEFPAKKRSQTHTWFIDPIDGTTNYIHGIPYCSISVGLFDEKGPSVGVVADP